MKRRQFLWAFAGLVVGAGFTAGSSVTNSSEAQGVVAIIFKRLGYLKLDRQGVLQFARDYTKQHLMSAGKLRALSAVRKLYLWVPQAWFNSLMPDIPLREERIVTTFLLSSDFFPGADERRTVRYLGFFGPQLRVNPFARLLGVLLAALLLAGDSLAARAAEPPVPEPQRMLQLGPGDAVAIHVYGQPDMDTTEYVADDGTIRIALAGAVGVNGLSPVEASEQVERALRSGKYLVDPHVTITLTQSRSQRVSVLGEVRTPGRYNIESNTTVFDVLAQAGGATAECADTVYVLRPDPHGAVARYAVDLKGLADGKGGTSTPALRGGDSVYVPRADRFYIYGEVQQPNMYKLEPGMTIVQAIARAGGVTARGSEKRIEVRRRSESGATVVRRANTTDAVRADDVIRVKESIF